MHSNNPLPTAGDTSWFTHDRFGMFIHWGTYTLAARHEWVKQRERIRDEDYQKYFDHFDPDLYDPKVWAQEAANAGMKYFVITTKHHEGFCLWDSALTDYKATKTPCGKDLLHPMVDAFRAQDLQGRVLPLAHRLASPRVHRRPDPPDARRPGIPRGAQGSRHPQVRRVPARPDARAADAVRQDQRALVRLLLRRPAVPVGPGQGPRDWQSEKLVKLVRELQPGIILNDRLDLPGSADVKTPEEYQPRGWMTVNGQPVVWEACQTFNRSWGYYRDNMDWREPDELIRTLIDTVSKGGNLLLNVGPNGRGEFDERSIERLRAIGEWMRLHSRSIYGCTASDLTPPPDTRFTYNPEKKRLYLHLFAWPYKHVHLDGLAGRVEYAQLLNDASEVKMFTVDPHQQAQNTTMGGVHADTLILELPIAKPKTAVPVVELFLKD